MKKRKQNNSNRKEIRSKDIEGIKQEDKQNRGNKWKQREEKKTYFQNSNTQKIH